FYRTRDRGDGIARRPYVCERGFHDSAQLLLCQLLARRVDRGEVRGVGCVAEVVRLDGEAEAVPATTEPEPGAGDELALEPRLVEPRRTELTRLVGHRRGEDVKSPPPSSRRAPHTDVEYCLVVAEELGDRALGRGRFVAARTVGENVADRSKPQPRELSLHR